MATAELRALRKSTEREMYLPAAIAISVLVVIGFARTYFLRPFVAHADSLTLLVHVHGALMTAWIALFCAQVTLVAIGRTDLHRRLDELGFVLLALILMVGVPTIIVAAKLGGDHMPGPALPGLALLFALLFEFLTLGGLGLLYRRRSDIHKRLMLLASISAMEAGVSRIPLDFMDSIPKVHVANDALLLIIIVIDTVRNRRMHPAFLWGSLFFVSVQTLSTWISGTSTWLQIAHSIMKAFA
jgi:hypothetical protein